jgi:hypothetical protein
MKEIKISNITTKSLLLFFGLVYFMLFSELNTPFFLKGYIPLVPIQIFVLGYFLFERVKRK